MKALKDILLAGTMVLSALAGGCGKESDLPPADAKAEISYTYVPPKGNERALTGKVNFTNAKSSDFKIATYILVNDKWWPKPYWNNQFSKISKSDNTFGIDIVTGGNDIYADAIYSAVVTHNYPPLPNGAWLNTGELPNAQKDKRVLANIEVRRDK